VRQGVAEQELVIWQHNVEAGDTSSLNQGSPVYNIPRPSIFVFAESGGAGQAMVRKLNSNYPPGASFRFASPGLSTSIIWRSDRLIKIGDTITFGAYHRAHVSNRAFNPDRAGAPCSASGFHAKWVNTQNDQSRHPAVFLRDTRGDGIGTNDRFIVVATIHPFWSRDCADAMVRKWRAVWPEHRSWAVAGALPKRKVHVIYFGGDMNMPPRGTWDHVFRNHNGNRMPDRVALSYRGKPPRTFIPSGLIDRPDHVFGWVRPHVGGLNWGSSRVVKRYFGSDHRPIKTRINY
jgi:hypothetical protein